MQNISPVLSSYNQWVAGRQVGPALPRPMADFLEGAFGPLQPLTPMPIDTPGESGRPLPRRWEYPVGWNLPVGQPGAEGLKLATFAAMRQYADRYSVVRSMINIRKDEISGTEWDVGPTDEVAAQTKGDKAAGKDQRERAAIIANFFKHVDPDYHGFQSWLSAQCEELFVIDAMTNYLHPTRVEGKGPFGSGLAAIEALSGDTIRPLLNLRGSTPRPPEPAYQQYLWGVPRADMTSIITGADLEAMEDYLRDAGIDIDGDSAEEYRADQLLYMPYTKRVWTPYGFSPIEQALIPITLGLNRQAFLLDYFTEGTIPGVYVIAGDSYVTPSQQKQLQDSLNALAGDLAWKHRVIVLPPGSTTDPQKDMTWAKEVDQSIVEQVAMILHIQPHEIGMVPGGRTSGLGGKGMAEQQAEAVAKTRTLPTLKWMKETLFNKIIQDVFGQKDLEWKWVGFEEDEDADTAATRDQTFISSGVKSIDQIRIENGDDPWNLPLTQSPVLISGASIIPLDPGVKPPPPPPAPAPPIAAGLGPDGNPAPGAPPAHAALAAASLPAKFGSNKPKNNPIANLTHEKKGKRKAARQELVDRFNEGLKEQSKQIADQQKEQEKRAEEFGLGKSKSDKVASTVVYLNGREVARAVDDALVPLDPIAGKVTVPNLLKWRIKYNDDKLDGDNGIVINYLRRSYPAKDVEWAADGKWTFEPKVKLSDIAMERRPGGRDPKKVEAIGKSLSNGASMDPVVLVENDDDGGPKYVVADGYHRCLGAVHAGWDEVPAFIGKGFEKDLDQISGPMQDHSDSKKKAAVAELAVLRRYLRKPGNKAENFRTGALDADVMALLPGKIEKVGLAGAMDWAREWIGKDGGNPQGLRDWYNAGADGQIDWGSDGDFMQCVNVASKYMDEDDAKGFCNNRHQDATGVAPGQEKIRKYDEGEARDAAGRWTSGGQLELPTGDHHEGLSASLTGIGFARGPVTRMTTEKDKPAPGWTGGWFQAPAPREGYVLHGRWSYSPNSGRYSPAQVDVVQPATADGLWARDAGASKTISLSSPLSTGLVPYDLDSGQRRASTAEMQQAASDIGGADIYYYYECPECGAEWPERDGDVCPNGHEFKGARPALRKFNPYHGEAGRFSSADAATGLQPRHGFGGWHAPGGYGKEHTVVPHLRDDGRLVCRTCRAPLGGVGVSVERLTMGDVTHGEPYHAPETFKYDPSEPRDEKGEWTAGGDGPTTDATDANHPGRTAVEALAKGETVNVSPAQVASVMKYANKHDFANPVRLENLLVEGTRQFGRYGLGLQRNEMPQVPTDRRQEFFDWLKDKYGTGVSFERVAPQTLQPSQSEISLERVAKMYSKMLDEGTGATTLLATKDDYILDGHHHWGAATALSFERSDVTVGAYRIDMNARSLIKAANAWDEEAGITHQQLTVRADLGKAAMLSAIDAELKRRGIDPASL